MNREATKYCEECKNCILIEIRLSNYQIQCKHRAHLFDDEVVYCKYKKLREENKKNVKSKN